MLAQIASKHHIMQKKLKVNCLSIIQENFKKDMSNDYISVVWKRVESYSKRK